MEVVTVDKKSTKEYLAMSRGLRERYLAGIVDNKNCQWLGSVSTIRENHCKIEGLKLVKNSGENNEDFIPFSDNRRVTSILGDDSVSQELIRKGIGIGDVVFLSLEPAEEREKKKNFKVKENSIVKIKDDSQRDNESETKQAELSGILTDDETKQTELNKIRTEIAKKQAELNEIHTEIETKQAELSGILADIKKKIQGKDKELSNLEEKYTEKSDRLDRQYTAKSNVIENKLRQEHAQKKKDLNEKMNIEMEQYKKRKEKLDKEIEIAEKKRLYLSKYKLFSDEENEQEPKEKPEKIYIADIKGKLKHIQGYLGAKKSLYYDLSIIQSLFLGLTTDQIIVLAGKPGSGKTSLLEGFAEAIDADMSLVPVQSNWIDRSDLLGFYNPIEKNYVPTPFLDAIIKASREAEVKGNEDKIFCICLDEMNLSHVEYYFAEFLSKLQTDRKIQLYSKTIFKDIREEVRDRNTKFELDIGNSTIEEFLTEYPRENVDNYFTLKRQYKMLYRYPDEIKIPPNVKFLGTINKDETTKDLSPKVIDRSFLIKLENEENNEMKKKLVKEVQANKEQYCQKIAFGFDDIKASPGLQDEKLEQELNNIKNDFKSLDISLSNRFEKAICQLMGNDVFARGQLWDTAISALILPKFNISSVDEDVKSRRAALEKICINRPISASVLREMCTDDNEELTYWR